MPLRLRVSPPSWDQNSTSVPCGTPSACLSFFHIAYPGLCCVFPRLAIRSPQSRSKFSTMLFSVPSVHFSLLPPITQQPKVATLSSHYKPCGSIESHGYSLASWYVWRAPCFHFLIDEMVVVTVIGGNSSTRDAVIFLTQWLRFPRLHWTTTTTIRISQSLCGAHRS